MAWLAAWLAAEPWLRRLSAVEALGRVDVACTDKTGTLTEGRLAVRLLTSASVDPVSNAPLHEGNLPGNLEPDLKMVLLTAALASPHPQATDAVAHPTDVAVITAARAAGLEEQLSPPHRHESPFEPDQAYHAAVVGDRLCLKGAPEAICPRCTRVHNGSSDQPLEEGGRQALLEQATRFERHGACGCLWWRTARPRRR